MPDQTNKKFTAISRSALRKRWNRSDDTLRRYEQKGLLHPLKLNGDIQQSRVDYDLAEVEKIEADAVITRRLKLKPRKGGR